MEELKGSNEEIKKENIVLENIKIAVNGIFQTRIYVILVGIAILLKAVLLYKKAIFANESMERIYTDMLVAFICILIAVPMLFKAKIRFWFATLLNLFTSIILFMNEVYYEYSSNLVSVSQISNLQYGKEISAALPSLLHIWHILYFLDILIVLILFFSKTIKLKKQKNYTYIIGIVYLIWAIYCFVPKTKIWIQEAEEYKYNKIQQIEKASIFGYHYLDIDSNIDLKKNAKYKSKNAMLKEYESLMEDYNSKYTLENDFTNIAKDKNVIIIQVESVQEFVVDKKINGKEITPNLNRFLKENIEFTNMQNQSYSTTADSEFAVMNSVYPLENGMCFSHYSSNDYDNIYKNFKNSDYETIYIHGNKGGFWNRTDVYSRLPIDKLLFDNIFSEDTERVSGYISDEQVYRRIVEELKGSDGKFMVNIVAASSHIAFDMPGLEDRERKVNIDVGDEYRGTLFGNYLEAMNYADYAFGIFIDELKAANLYEDTVILVYGDHAGLQMYNEEMLDYLNRYGQMNDIQTQINYSNVLCGLKIPGVEHFTITKPTSKIDLKPTLMEICGIEDNFSIGKSIFTNKNFACINNARIITDKYFYNEEWYSIQTGNPLNVEDLTKEEIEKLNFYVSSMQKELDISLSINVLNLLK
jgi:phosphoglycerol transferase MdoB-like AlkP superfamily enzyme